MFSLTPGRAAQNLGQPGHCGPCRLQAFSLQPSRASEGCKSLRKHCRGSDCLTLSGCKGHSSSLGPGQGAQDQATTPFSSLVKAFCLSASLLPSEKGVWVRIFPKILMTDIVTVSKDCSHTHTHTHTQLCTKFTGYFHYQIHYGSPGKEFSHFNSCFFAWCHGSCL
jgi:hypothetical protein